MYSSSAVRSLAKTDADAAASTNEQVAAKQTRLERRLFLILLFSFRWGLRAQIPRFPVRNVEPFRIACATDKLFLFRIPLQMRVIQISDVHEMAHRHRSRADLHITNRLLARANAIQPITRVIAALVKFDRICGQRSLAQNFRSRFE